MDSFNTLNFIAVDHPQKREVISKHSGLCHDSNFNKENTGSILGKFRARIKYFLERLIRRGTIGH